MKIFLALLLAIYPNISLALVTTNKVLAFNRSEGAYLYENYAVQQSFDKNLNGVTTLGGTTSIVTGSTKLIGAGSLSWATAANTDIMVLKSKAMPIGMNGLNCQSKFTYATPYGGPVSTQEFTVQAKNSAGTAISALTNLPATFNIANTQASRTVIVYYPCPYNSATPANSYVQLEFKHTASNSTAFIMDELFHTYAVDIGAGVPNNVFSAKVSSAGVVTDENEDWISGNCSAGSPSTCTLVPGKFNVPPTCNITYGPSVSGFREIAMNSVSTSSIVLNTYNGSGSASANNVMVVCTRAGSDFIQPAITPNQWNYGPTAYTPTLGAGFGTPTNVSFFHWRTGKFLNVSGTFITGTTGAAIGSISLPSGLAIDTTVITVNNTTAAAGWRVGGFSSAQAATGASGTIVTATGTSPTTVYITGNNGNGAGQLIPSSNVGSNVAISSTLLSFEFRVPIAGWTENQNAPQLIGSLTTDGSSSDRFATLSFGGSSTDKTITCTGTCQVLYQNYSGFGTPTRNTTGTYFIPADSWMLRSTTSCWASGHNNLSTTTRTEATPVPGSSRYTVRVFGTSSDAFQDAQVNFYCTGPR